MSIDFDQFVEYVDVNGVHFVAIEQHELASPFTLGAIKRGYRNVASLGRPLLPNGVDLAFVFHESGVSVPDNAAISTLATWTAKSISASYVIAPTATIDAINAARTVAIALIRISVSSEDEPLAPDEPFTDAQVSALSTWLNEHEVTNTQFAALFGVTALQLANWLKTNPRWRLVQVMHDKFAE